MTDLFLTAARRKFRFPSTKGQLTIEQLFDLPLTSAAGSSLDNTAQQIDAELQTAGRRSFVATADNTAQTELSQKLAIVMAIIEIKQTENANEKARRDRREQRQRLLQALDDAERNEISSKSPAELRRMIAELAD